MFLKEGRDPFIDFVKGVSIFFVILTHNIPNQKYILFCIWGAQAVPLFLLIQSYHGYNSFNRGKLTFKQYFSPESLFKVYKRIILPFLKILLLQIAILFVLNELKIKDVINQGGYGPGSYYIWIYLQFFLLIPISYPLMRRISNMWLFIIFVLISECFEVFCSVISLPDQIYRLLFFRYFFLIYLGFILSKQPLKINFLNTILSIVALVFILTDNYLDVYMQPFIYKTAWKGVHWIAYFYTVYFFLSFLKVIYKYFYVRNIFNFIERLGQYSYEIFLCQMFIFGFLGMNKFNFINNIYLKVIVFICVTTLFSILPVFIYKNYLIRNSTANNVS